MGLKSSYEPMINKVYGLSEYIISLGSFERDGILPYVYNNQMTGIVIQDIDENFVATNNNNIGYSKDVMYNAERYNVPLLTNQINYEIIETIAKNNLSKTSIVFVMEYYKQIIEMTSELDQYGMLLYGFRYAQANNSAGTNDYNFNTIGIRGRFGSKDNKYGIFIWGEALIYGQDNNSNPTIDSIVGSKTDELFIPYDYSIENFTIMCTTESEVDTSGNETNKLLIEFKDIKATLDLTLTIDTSGGAAADKFTSDKIYKCITMPNYSQNIDYSYFHIKTFGDKLTMDELEKQTHILVTLQGVEYV